jgi:hypothetical protein
MFFTDVRRLSRCTYKIFIDFVYILKYVTTKEKHLSSTLALPYTLSPKRLLSAAKEQRWVKRSAVSVNVHERCGKDEE